MCAETLRKARIVDTIGVGQYVCGHKKCAKKQIPQIGKVPAKFMEPPRTAAVWCQRWNTGPATTYLNGPSVQFRLACTKADVAVVKGPTQSITFGEMPASNKLTSTRTVPKNMLNG